MAYHTAAICSYVIICIASGYSNDIHADSELLEARQGCGETGLYQIHTDLYNFQIIKVSRAIKICKNRERSIRFEFMSIRARGFPKCVRYLKLFVRPFVPNV